MTTRPVSRKSENSAKLTKAPVSSASARRLCKAALKRYGSLRKAAAALGLKSYGQLYAIMNGRMYDTPEMKAALRRADRRAKRAWELVRDEGPKPRVDVEGLRGSIQAIEYQLRLMRELLKKSGIDVPDAAQSSGRMINLDDYKPLEFKDGTVSIASDPITGDVTCSATLPAFVAPES